MRKTSGMSRALVRRETTAGYLFMLPSLFFFLVFVIYPMFMCIYTSLFDSNMGKNTVDVFIGLNNYKELFGDEVFLGRDFSSGENLSEETVAKIDREIRRIVGEGKEHAKQLLSANLEKLHRVADYLVKYEVMDGTQFAALMDDGASEDDLVEMTKQKEEQSKRENTEAAALRRLAAPPEIVQRVPRNGSRRDKILVNFLQ